MRITAELTPLEWAQEREMLAAHLAEWLDEGPRLAKAGGQVAVAPGAHPMRAIDEMTDRLTRAYRGMLEDMNQSVIDYLHGQIGQEPH